MSPKRPSEGRSRETAPGPSEKDLRRQLLISGIGSNARSSFCGTGGQIRWGAPLLSFVCFLSLFLVRHKHPIGAVVQVAALLLTRKECNYYKLSYPLATFVKPNSENRVNKKNITERDSLPYAGGAPARALPLRPPWCNTFRFSCLSPLPFRSLAPSPLASPE